MKIINNFLAVLFILFFCSVIFFYRMSNMIPTLMVILGCYVIPSMIITITMVMQIKHSDEEIEKKEIRNFWIKILFLIYCILLIELSFFENEYKLGFNYQSVWSKEHLSTVNFMPFSTIATYIKRLAGNSINYNIVIINIFSNFILLAPMGFFIPVIFNKKIRHIGLFIFIIVLIGIFIEITQFFTLSGYADIDDVIIKTLGACLVYLLMRVNFVKEKFNL